MKASLIRWYLTALLLFWGPTAVAFLIEYEAETRGGARSTVLENVLTVPMFLGFLAGAGLWAFAVITTASRCKTSAGSAVVVLLGVLFAAANLVGLLIAHLWFVIDVMCWDSL